MFLCCYKIRNCFSEYRNWKVFTTGEFGDQPLTLFTISSSKEGCKEDEYLLIPQPLSSLFSEEPTEGRKGHQIDQQYRCGMSTERNNGSIRCHSGQWFGRKFKDGLFRFLFCLSVCSLSCVAILSLKSLVGFNPLLTAAKPKFAGLQKRALINRVPFNLRETRLFSIV